MNKQNHKKNKYFFAVFFIYLLILLRITVFRNNVFDNPLFSGSLNLNLFSDLISILKNDFFTFIYLFIGNIIWFVPFGFFISVNSTDYKILNAIIYGFLLSLLIECLQFVFSSGVSEIDDLILNTFGSFIGAIIGKFYIMMIKKN